MGTLIAAGGQGFVFSYSQCADPGAEACSARGAPDREALLRAGARWRSAPRCGPGSRSAGRVWPLTRIRTTTRLSGSSRRPSPRGAGGRAVRGLRGGVGCALRARSRQAQWELIFRVRTGTTTRLSGSSRRPSPRGAGGRAVREGMGRWGAPFAPDLGRPNGSSPGGQCHYPAERSSRRPSPRGAGGRAVRGLRGGGVRPSRPI